MSGLPIAVEETFVKVIAHLEFMGYSCSFLPSDVVRAEHTGHCTLLIRKVPTGMMLSALFGRGYGGAIDPDGYMGFVNGMNEKMIVARSYIDKDCDLVFEAFWPAIYDKKTFGEWIGLWWHDTDFLLAERSAKAKNYLSV